MKIIPAYYESLPGFQTISQKPLAAAGAAADTAVAAMMAERIPNGLEHKLQTRSELISLSVPVQAQV